MWDKPGDFLNRFNENKTAFRTNNQNSNYVKHLTEHTHPFGPIQDTMQILQRQNKRAHLSTIERYYLYREFTKNSHLNDEHTNPPTRSLKLCSHPTNRNPPTPSSITHIGHTNEPPPWRRSNYPHVVHAFRYAASYNKHRNKLDEPA